MFGIRRKEGDHFPLIIEVFILIAIVMVIAHTVVEELSLIYHWSHANQVRISLAGFGFDLLFSIEFFARSFVSLRRFEFRKYFFSERGWVDMITSLPLLFMISGPALIYHLMGQDAAITSMELLHILKTAKAIRVTRVLRLIRVMKLFGRIQNTESSMTNRHVGVISTISVVSLILVLVGSQFLPFLAVGDHAGYREHRVAELTPLFTDKGRGAPNERWLAGYLKAQDPEEDIIYLKNPKGKIIYENDRKNELRWTSFSEKDIPLGKTGYTMALSFHPADAQHAKLSLFVLVSILTLIIAMVLFYTRIFAQQVADPIFIMNRGLREWNYNLEVRISDHHRNEEIYRLARAYNVRWLALKNQILKYKKKHGAGEKSRLKVEDIF